MRTKGRTYQRSERATRTVSRTTQPARNPDATPIKENGPQIFSLCLQAGPAKKRQGNLLTRRKGQWISQKGVQHEPRDCNSLGLGDGYLSPNPALRSSCETKEIEKGHDADTEDEEEDESAYLSDDPPIGTSGIGSASYGTGVRLAPGTFFKDQLIADEGANPEGKPDQALGRSKVARLNPRRKRLAARIESPVVGALEPYLLDEDEGEPVDEKVFLKSRKEKLEQVSKEIEAPKDEHDPPADNADPAGIRQRSCDSRTRGPEVTTISKRVKSETDEERRLLPPVGASREVTTPSTDLTIERESELPRPPDGVFGTRDRRPMARFEGVEKENVREGCIVCGRSETLPIKARGGERKKTRTKNWIPKVFKLSKITKVAWRALAFLCLTFLLLAVIGHLFSPHPQVDIRLTMYLKTVPLPPEESSSDSHPPIPSSPSDESRPTYPPAPQTREPDGSPSSDPVKAALDSLPLPSVRYMTPAIIAINHLESLPVRSSHPTHEFLGRGITVSIRKTNGHLVHHQGDLHLRLFLRGVENGWKDIYLPSRTEIDHLVGLWNREPGYQGAMAQIRTDFDRVHLLSDDPPSERSTWEVFEEREVAMGEAEDGEVSRVPPNSPDKTARVGPPPTRTGQRARRRHPFPKHSVSTDSSTRDCGLGKLAEAAVRVKEEEDEDAPYRMGLLTRGSLPVGIEMAPLPQGSPPDIPPPPPDLTYPDDENSRTHLSGTSGKVTEFNGPFGGTTDPDDNDPPPPLLPASPPPITLKRGRTSKAILSDIVLCLYKLRFELGVAFDLETQGMIEKMEKSTHRLMMMDVAKGSSEAHAMVAGPDGDIVMGERGRAVSEGPGHHSAVPTEYSLSPASLSRFDELMDRVRTLQGMILSYQWKKVDDQNDFGERLDRLDARVAALEALRIEDDTATTSRRRTYREPPERPLTRGNAHRLDNKIEQCSKAVNDLQTRIREAETLLENLRGSRERVQEAERRIVRVEGAIGKQDIKFADLVTRIDEVLLQRSAIRDLPTSHEAPSPGFYLRVSRIESNQLNFNQRISSTEEQLSLVEQRLRCFWLIGASADPADALTQVAHLRHMWATATLAWNRRQSQGNPGTLYSQPASRSVTITAPGPARGHISADDDPPKPNDKPSQY